MKLSMCNNETLVTIICSCTPPTRGALPTASGFAPDTERVIWTQVPVGPECLGRIMNVIGEPVDEVGPHS